MSLDSRVSDLRGNDILTVILNVTGTLRLEAGDLVYTRRMLLVR